MKIISEKKKVNEAILSRKQTLDFFNNYIKDRDDLEDSTKSRLKNCIRSKE